MTGPSIRSTGPAAPVGALEIVPAGDLELLSTAPIHRLPSAMLWARDGDAAILLAKRDTTKRNRITFSSETLPERVAGSRHDAK